MTQRDEQLHIPLNHGFADRVIDEALPPLMRVSRNTRFSVDRGIVRKLPLAATFAGTGYADVGHSLVPTGRRSIVGYSIPGNPQLLLDDASLPAAPTLKSPFSSQSPQNAYCPMQVVSSCGTGARTIEITDNNVRATSILNGPNLWVVSMAAHGSSGTTISGASGVPAVEAAVSGNNYDLMVSVFDVETGRALAPNRPIVLSYSGADAFRIGITLKLTIHNDTSKIHIWYQKSSAVTIFTRSVSLNASTRVVTAGTETAVANPLGSVADNPFDVATGGARGHGDPIAWLIRRSSGFDQQLVIEQYDTATLTSIRVVGITSAVANITDPVLMAIDAARVYNGTNYHTRIGVAYRSVTGTAGQTLARGYTVATTIGIPSIVFSGVVCDTVAPSFVSVVLGTFVANGGSAQVGLYVCTQRSQTSAALGTSKKATVISTVSFGSLVKETETLLDWYECVGRPGIYSHVLPTAADWGSSVTDVVDVLIPVFPMARNYSNTGAGPEITLDPAVTVFCLSAETDSSSQIATPIARLGSFDSTSVAHALRLCSGYDETFAVAYEREPRPNDPYSRVGTELVATLLRSSRACASAVDDTGAALIAGAQPAYFDGLETTELAPLYQPVLRAETYAAGTSFASGDYRFTAIYVWTDAAGQTHRSAPAVSQTLTLSNALGARVYVTYPSGSMKSGYSQYAARVEIYAAAPGALVHLFSTFQPTLGTLGVATFEITDPPTATNAVLYSDSGELVPTCPGALHDVAIVGARAWGVLAERRNVATYSKLRQAGIAYEFPAEFEVEFPASAGKLQRVLELDGNPVFLAENGVFVVVGVGPDNAGNGVAYGDPRKISDIGCVARDSAVRTGAGVLYAARGAFAMLASGGAVQRLPQIDPELLGTIVAAVDVRDASEAWVFGRSGTYTHLVLNYETGGWSRGENVAQAVHVALAGDLLIASHGTGLSALDTDSDTPTAAAVVIQTGWIQPSGPQAACVLRELLIQAVRDKGGHGLTVDVSLDYSTGAEKTISFSFSAADIAEAADDATERYTLRCVLKAQPARALRVTLTETGTTGAFCPLSATLVYSSAAEIQRKFTPAATK
jgi:hypothetical protein